MVRVRNLEIGNGNMEQGTRNKVIKLVPRLSVFDVGVSTCTYCDNAAMLRGSIDSLSLTVSLFRLLVLHGRLRLERTRRFI